MSKQLELEKEFSTRVDQILSEAEAWPAWMRDGSLNPEQSETESGEPDSSPTAVATA